ncbi:MAG: sugar phosphate isomerase/epimerase family protein [Christensenella sp.]|uniref:sugar phosphate isomerase/epimerase family protein n=1 Tax=Christensenella sp. TaxID=1935934 RepID=UPI002B1FCE02|nr:sugar phosphate isomerase/epimerase family protein [Christensenella sp.]MEA5002162.1 sugar phosphate isomerase/epimerase family protein [Christensenella sp.]
MKLCFSTLGCPEWSFSDIISTACDLGYDGIEIRGVGNVIDAARIPEFFPETAPKTRKTLEDKGLKIACLTSACYMNDTSHIDDILYLAKAYVDTAHDMGIKNIRVLGDFGPEQSGELHIPEIAARIKELAQYAKPEDVNILVETNGFFANSYNMEKLMNGIDEENAGVLWDIHHPYRYFGEKPADTIGVIGDLIRHVHIKDSLYEDGKLKYTMVGYGDLPVKECVELLKKIGYDGYYSLEWLKRWDLSLEEPGIAFAGYASYMKSLV